MRLEIEGKEYLLQIRMQEVAPKLESYPEAVADKPLSQLSLKELATVAGRIRRNLAKSSVRTVMTSATLIRMVDGVEVEQLNATVVNHKGDVYDAARGRREAIEKLKMVALKSGKSVQWNRALATAFYNKYPKSRPHATRG